MLALRHILLYQRCACPVATHVAPPLLAVAPVLAMHIVRHARLLLRLTTHVIRVNLALQLSNAAAKPCHVHIVVGPIVGRATSS